MNPRRVVSTVAEHRRDVVALVVALLVTAVVLGLAVAADLGGWVVR